MQAYTVPYLHVLGIVQYFLWHAVYASDAIWLFLTDVIAVESTSNVCFRRLRGTAAVSIVSIVVNHCVHLVSKIVRFRVSIRRSVFEFIQRNLRLVGFESAATNSSSGTILDLAICLANSDKTIYCEAQQCHVAKDEIVKEKVANFRALSIEDGVVDIVIGDLAHARVVPNDASVGLIVASHCR